MHPDIADIFLSKLQVTERAALRIATGCTSFSPSLKNHLPRETQVPLKYHMGRRDIHMFSCAHHPAHPLHSQRKVTARRPRSNPSCATPASFYQTTLDSNLALPEPPHLEHMCILNLYLENLTHIDQILSSVQAHPFRKPEMRDNSYRARESTGHSFYVATTHPSLHTCTRLDMS